MEGQRVDDSALEAQVRFDRGDWENPAASLKFMQQKAFEWLFFFPKTQLQCQKGDQFSTTGHTHIPTCLSHSDFWC